MRRLAASAHARRCCGTSRSFSAPRYPARTGTAWLLGTKPLRDLTKADVEAFREARRQAHADAVRERERWEAEAATLPPGAVMDRRKPRLAPGDAGGEVGINRVMERLRHLLNWAIEQGYSDSTPFKRHGQVVVRLTKETARHRRLVDAIEGATEEEQLLRHASPHLRAVLVALLDSGCRIGEVLSLQWRDVRSAARPTGPQYTLVLSATKTKTATTREIPCSTRLAALLEMRRLDPEGNPHRGTAYVFGDETGGRIRTVRKAWETCVLKAHGHTPEWTTGYGRGKSLSAASRALYRAANLHLHDLRRQFASTLMESGAALVEVKELLGHASISQTSTYLASSAKGLSAAIRRKELHEAQLAEARTKQASQQTGHTVATQPASPLADAEGSDAIQVVKH